MTSVKPLVTVTVTRTRIFAGSESELSKPLTSTPRPYHGCGRRLRLYVVLIVRGELFRCLLCLVSSLSVHVYFSVSLTSPVPSQTPMLTQISGTCKVSCLYFDNHPRPGPFPFVSHYRVLAFSGPLCKVHIRRLLFRVFTVRLMRTLVGPPTQPQ